MEGRYAGSVWPCVPEPPAPTHAPEPKASAGQREAGTAGRAACLPGAGTPRVLGRTAAPLTHVPSRRPRAALTGTGAGPRLRFPASAPWKRAHPVRAGPTAPLRCGPGPAARSHPQTLPPKSSPPPITPASHLTSRSGARPSDRASDSTRKPSVTWAGLFSVTVTVTQNERGSGARSGFPETEGSRDPRTPGTVLGGASADKPAATRHGTLNAGWPRRDTGAHCAFRQLPGLSEAGRRAVWGPESSDT